MDTTVLVIGAGPAGLASAHYLQQRNIPYLLLERQTVGYSWQNHYDRLHLHTLKEVSALPGLPMPAEYPEFASRQQVVDYLQYYARHFDLNVQENTVVESADYHAYHQTWHVKTSRGELTARYLIAATGIWARPIRPTFGGEDDFTGCIMHASEYKNADSFTGQKVLVVGGGNTGTEVAVEVAEAGAEAAILIRDGTVFVPYPDSAGKMKAASWLFRHIPHGVGEAMLQRSRPNFENIGIAWPDKPLMEAYPVVGFELPQAVEEGRVTLYTAGIDHFTSAGVVFEDGQAAEFDTVILATGYRPAVEFLNDAVAFDKNGWLILDRYHRSTRNDHLYCVGYHYPALEGWIQSIPRVADTAVRQLAKQL